MAAAKVQSAPFRLARIPLGMAKFLRLENQFQKELFLVLVVGTSIWYLLSLGTFSAADPSAAGATIPFTHVRNLAGTWGATIAGLVLFFVGAVAFLVPLPFIAQAVLTVRNKSNDARWSRFFGLQGCLATAFCLTALTGSAFVLDGQEFKAAGELGILTSKYLTSHLGRAGSFIALLTFGSSALLLVTRRSLLHPIQTKISQVAEKMRDFEFPSGFIYTRNGKKIAEAPVVPLTEELRNMHSMPVLSPEEGPSFQQPDITQSFSALQSVIPSEPSMFVEKDIALSSRLPMQVAPYTPPPVSIFQRTSNIVSRAANGEHEVVGRHLVKTLGEFGITGKIIDHQPGPVVTVYEFQPDAGIKLSRVLGLMDDLALALKVDSIFIHPVKGKTALGIQVPNSHRETVLLGDIVSSEGFRRSESPLTFAMGKSISGEPAFADLATMPHLLAAGATGSGKSVAINTILCSIIMKSAPEDVRLILVDPKMLELSVYEGIPHLLMPVITEPNRASFALKWAAHEMERRYRLMQHAAVRNISGFNTFWEKVSPEKRDEINRAMGKDNIGKLPYIVLVIDELADLMMTAPKDVETSIQRLAQKARASGIHLVLATQRPSVDIITGVIKANLPCRISFQVVSKHDSRTILDQVGSEKLLGKGDMLFQRPGTGRLERIHGAFISDEEVLRLVAAARCKGKPVYDSSIIAWIDDEVARQSVEGEADSMVSSDVESDPKYSEAVHVGSTFGVVSASFLQRHLKIGYNRAARIVEYMEAKGLVAKADGAKPRKWLGSTSNAA